ncbi:MAG: hypothetical protein GY826_25375, partial [Fuerstiella sp.]|nr:hypothetical protein [Fuerstiella sp.]
IHTDIIETASDNLNADDYYTHGRNALRFAMCDDQATPSLLLIVPGITDVSHKTVSIAACEDIVVRL